MNSNNKKEKVVQIQKWFRGNIFRLKRLPMILHVFQNYLSKSLIQFNSTTDDGRINSCIDEDTIIDLLCDKFESRIIKPKIRMWYDILANDYYYGWIPINIKSTTTKTCDNTGNFAMCVHTYTDKEIIDVKNLKPCRNGVMSKILVKKIAEKTRENREYNKRAKKDYYFLVANKNDPKDIIINSLKGLELLRPNINNLPFQVCWDKNRNFKYDKINKKIDLFIKCIQKPKPSYTENFLKEFRKLELDT